MHRPLSVALSAATALAAVGLSACSSPHPKTGSSAASSLPPASSSQVAAPVTAPLPPPEALTDVLTRLADPNVPGASKVNLVEGATPESAATLDKFTAALRDNGYLPMTFNANDIAWSDKNPSNVKATIAVHTAQANNANFTFPMEFAPFQGGWQLSRHTAEMLLALGNSPTAPTSGAPAASAGLPRPDPPRPAPAPSTTAATALRRPATTATAAAPNRPTRPGSGAAPDQQNPPG